MTIGAMGLQEGLDGFPPRRRFRLGHQDRLMPTARPRKQAEGNTKSMTLETHGALLAILRHGTPDVN